MNHKIRLKLFTVTKRKSFACLVSAQRASKRQRAIQYITKSI